ncbi:unnamed protein product [Prunus armeniaca]|uniref:WRC domain-containing protein n=1 Tax=Prunus armeniaca TaxID=36596 RepID=A0A6J5U132_PRUAR|nr:unnamed protein product [Prunus armeniaca]
MFSRVKSTRHFSILLSHVIRKDEEEEERRFGDADQEERQGLPLLFSSHAPAAEDLQAHVCQLNQSPWDVISFGPDSNQLEESFYVNNNGSFGDSLGAAESVASMMDIGKEKAVLMEQEPVADDKKGSNSKELLDDDNEEEGRRSSYACCQKNDGKGWHCKKRAKLGQSFCNHHLSLLRSNHNTNIASNIRAPGKLRARCYQLEPAAPGPRRRGDPPQTLTNSITIRGLARCGGERGAGIRRRKSPRLMKTESLLLLQLLLLLNLRLLKLMRRNSNMWMTTMTTRMTLMTMFAAGRAGGSG